MPDSPDAVSRSALFALKYPADRAHELEMVKFTGQVEIAFLQGLFVLNGGAAGAFVALLGGSALHLGAVAPGRAKWALVCWLLGLLIAGVAGLLIHRAQQNFTTRARHYRHAGSIAAYGGNDPDLLGTLPEDDASTLRASGEMAGQQGDSQWSAAEILGGVSALCFVVGCMLAANAVIYAAQLAAPK